MVQLLSVKGISLPTQVELDISFTNPGEFKNILLIKSQECQTLLCTTSVYSFGTRILETQETQMSVAAKQGHHFHFDIVPQFFTAFFAGFQYLQSAAEAESAVKNLTIVQV